MRLSVFLFVTALASAQTYNFETDESGWMVLGSGGSVHIVRGAKEAKSGSGALKFDYEVAPKSAAVAIVPTPSGVPQMQSLRFWIKTTASTPVAVILSERKPGGGDYAALFWSPAGDWHRVELGLSDFIANDGPNDPKDSDGKLDLDQVQAIGVVDLAFFLSNIPENPDMPVIIERASGSRSIFLDDFEISPKPPAMKASNAIDDFAAPPLRWMTPGGVSMNLSVRNPLNEPALEATYEQKVDGFPVMVRRVPGVDKGDRLELDLASAQDADIMISLEEHRPGRQGPRFNYTVDVPASRKPVHKTIAFSDFKPEDITSDARVDASLVKTITLVDITASSTGRNEHNTLWVGRVLATNASR